MGRVGTGVENRGTSIRIKFVYEGETCKERLTVNGVALRPTPANLRAATRLAVEIRNKIEAGSFVYGEYFPDSDRAKGTLVETSLHAQMQAWLGLQRIEESTKAGYSSAIKFWTEVVPVGQKSPLGFRELRSLVHSDLLGALASRPTLHGKTVNNYVSVLREALDLAVADKILAENPADKIPRAKFQKDPPDPFNLTEVESIITYFREHYPEDVYNLVEWRFFSGVRTSEAFGLRWPNVDLASKYMRITEAVVRGVAKSNTKTNVSRDVSLISRSLAAITRQKAHTFLKGQHVWTDSRYGEPWTEERAFRRSYWEPCLKRLGIRYRPPNNMRHTYATMMLMAGRKPAWCAKQLGHSVEMFLRTYAKWIPGDQDDFESSALDEWVTRASNDSSHSRPADGTKTS